MTGWPSTTADSSWHGRMVARRSYGADQQYRLILAAHPDDAEAWNILGELTLHKGHLLGRAWVDARAAYERVLALDPGSAWSLWWLAAIAVREAGAPISTR